MKKIVVLLIIISMCAGLIGCGGAGEDEAFIDEPSSSSKNDKVGASTDVQLLAQYEVDMLVRVLTESGVYKDNDYSGTPIKIEIRESKILNLQLAKQLDFHDGATIELYEFDFKLLPKALNEEDLFVLDEEGWILSDDNFGYVDARGGESAKGQLYLVLHNSHGELSSLGIRRADALTEERCSALLANYNYPKGVNFDMSSISGMYDYWKWDEEWSFTMPCYNAIHVGSTTEEMNVAYPEAFKVENYGAFYEKESGIVEHDSCWCYAPERTNRSILFLAKEGVIVQIDMADGLDGQYTSPSGTGTFF